MIIPNWVKKCSKIFGTSILFSQKYWEFHHPNGQKILGAPSSRSDWNAASFQCIGKRWMPKGLWQHDGQGLQCPSVWPTWWFIPRIVSGLVHPSSKWTNPTYPIYNQGCNPLTKWDEPPSKLLEKSGSSLGFWVRWIYSFNVIKCDEPRNTTELWLVGSLSNIFFKVGTPPRIRPWSGTSPIFWLVHVKSCLKTISLSTSLLAFVFSLVVYVRNLPGTRTS